MPHQWLQKIYLIMFFKQVQEQNQNLRDALEKETKKPVAASSAAAEMIDFKKMFAETKAHSRAIDMELRQCEVEETRLAYVIWLGVVLFR